MKPNHKSSILLSFAALAATSGFSQAATIANWQVLNADNPTVSGLTSDSPVFGSGSSNSVANMSFAGRFGTDVAPESVTLAVGETLTVTSTITFTGGTSTPNNGDFRFGVFNDGGQFAADTTSGWAGGWVYAVGNAAQAGFYQGRTDVAGHFMSTASPAVNLTPTISTTGGAFSAASATSYTWTMSITRDSATTVDLVTSLIGGPNSYSQIMTENNVTTSLFTYTSMGFYSTTNGQLDRLNIGAAQYSVSVIPEPSTAVLLGGLGFLILLRRRR